MKDGTSKNSLQVLLVEDSASDVAFLRESLFISGVDDISISVAGSLQEAVSHLKNNHTDAALMDLTLPDSNGLDTVRQVGGTYPDLPIVVLTGVDDEKMGVEAVRIGAQDYLIKGQSDGKLIVRAIRYAIERKQAEQEIQRLAKFPSEDPYPVLRIAEDGAILYSNASGITLLDSWGRAIGETAPADWCRIIRNVIESGQPQVKEKKLQGRILSFVFAPVPEEGYVNMYGRDITKQVESEKLLIKARDELELRVKQRTAELAQTVNVLQGEVQERMHAENALRESEEKYRSLVEVSPDGIGVEIDDKVVFVNTAGAKLLGGSSPEQFIARPIMDFVHPDFVERTQKQLMLLRKKKKKLPLGESKFLRLDGTSFDVEVAATPLIYEDKAAVQIVFRDITERKIAQEKILADQKQLRSLTAELALTEERERHTAAMALHDSLGPLLAFSKRELGVLQKDLPSKTADVLKNISNNISEAIKHTRNLTFDLSPPALYVFGLETATAELAEKFCEDGKLQINFENTADQKPLTDHIKILLYRCVRELLINIAKHAQAKNVRIAFTRDNDNMKIVVKDDGKGFDTSRLEGKPKGFGLFSIRERLTHIGGVFDIQSVSNKGTTVTLLAPLEIKKG
jgi:PAS domain S-box-containing protein